MRWRIPSCALLLGVLPLGHALPIDSNKSFANSQNNPTNDYLGHLVTKFAPGDALLCGTGRVWTKLQGLTVPLSGGPKIQTDIVSNQPCADMTLIFARATTEPGNMGGHIGPQLVNGIRKAIAGRTLNVQGVEYAATFQGYLGGGGADGTANMSALIHQALEQCPETKLVLSGYSQGAQVVHNAAKSVGPAVMSQVSSVVLFGDPFFRTGPVQGAETKSLVICHAGDNICNNGILVLPPHLTYELDIPQAVAFVAGMAGFQGEDMMNQMQSVQQGMAEQIMGWRVQAKFFARKVTYFIRALLGKGWF